MCVSATTKVVQKTHNRARHHKCPTRSSWILPHRFQNAHVMFLILGIDGALPVVAELLADLIDIVVFRRCLANLALGLGLLDLRIFPRCF
jgi:hypothetical protein